ncbi:MAG: Uncharacterised protein [Porticoccaceae bacterium UBA1117]|nr:MAG: Uncharacterised protein [Porticoccaceae bacterium UBA1117]
MTGTNYFQSFALPTELHHLFKRTANISRYFNYRNTKGKNIFVPVYAENEVNAECFLM